MNRLIFLVAAVSSAKASSWSLMGPVIGSQAYGRGMVPNSEMSHGHDMQTQSIMWPYSMMSGLGVPGAARTGSSGVSGRRLSGSLCKGQMIGSNMNQMSHNKIECEQMEKMGQFLNNLERVMQPVGSGLSNVDSMPHQVGEMTEQIIQQAHQIEQLHMQQAVQEIWQLGSSMVVGSGSSMVPQMAQQQAVNLLDQITMQLKNGMMMGGQSNVTKHLAKTIEVAMMSQMAMSSVHKQESIHSSIMTGEQMISNFVNHFQQMIEQYNEMLTEIAIMVYQTQLQQVQAQLQFVNQQVEHMKIYQTTMVRESAQGPQSFQHVLSEMYQQLHNLMSQQVALQMVVTVLQEVMLSQKNMMQELVMQEVHHQSSDPSMHMHSMPMMMSKSTKA